MTLKLFGINKKLHDQIEKAGITTKTQLKNSPLYEKLSKATKLHLKYNISNIPYDIATKILNHINLASKLKYNAEHFIPVGSYSRGIQKSGDLDILTTLAIDESTTLIQNMPEIKYIDKYASGKNKTTIIISLEENNSNNKLKYYTIDIFYTLPENLIFALFHYVGNRQFNIRSRRLAKLRGYKLSQYGLFKNNQKVKISNERELFNILGITYKKPNERNE